jgi:hypothetical protein
MRMATPRPGSSQRTDGARRRREGLEDTAACPPAAGSLLALLSLAACVSTPAALAPDDVARRSAALEAMLERSAEPPPPGSVRIRLAFGSGADLDLYVTDADPHSNETVYFAKHTTRSGGRLLRDARCGDAAPRSDAALFELVPESGLRVGVDHHASCADPPASEPFVVEIAHGEQREVRRGVARPGHFDDRFWLWVPATAPAGAQYMPNVK